MKGEKTLCICIITEVENLEMVYKGKNKITELRKILQRESQNS